MELDDMSLPIFERFLTHYEAGNFATQEAAHIVIRSVQPEIWPEMLEAVTKHPELLEAMKKVVSRFKGLTDDEWSKVLTLRMGSWIIRERRNGQTTVAKGRQETAHLKRGVEYLVSIGFN